MASEYPQKDNLPLVAYKELIGLLKHEETLFWNRNQIFLIINAAILSILGLIHPSKDELVTLSIRIISAAFCIFAMMLAILWYLIIRRSEAFYNHWYEQLKFLEIQYLSPLNVFNIADFYFDKGYVKIGSQEFKLKFIEKCLRIFVIMRTIALILLVAWIILGIFLFFFTHHNAADIPPGFPRGTCHWISNVTRHPFLQEQTPCPAQEYERSRCDQRSTCHVKTNKRSKHVNK